MKTTSRQYIAEQLTDRALLEQAVYARSQTVFDSATAAMETLVVMSSKAPVPDFSRVLSYPMVTATADIGRKAVDDIQIEPVADTSASSVETDLSDLSPEARMAADARAIIAAEA